MGADLEARVSEIHRRAFIVDAHFDLAYDVANRRERSESRVIETTYLDSFRESRVDLIVSSIFIHSHFLPEMGLRKALDQIAMLHQEMEESPGCFALCRTMGEVEAARERGEVAILLSLEGADPIQNDLNLLRIFHELGVRGVGLVWSRRNYVGDGCFLKPGRSGRAGGLTDFGISLIEKAEELGMFIDVSHLNDPGFADVMAVARGPVIASHSNCRALADTPRNLTDAQIEAIAQKGGVIGMNGIDRFIREPAETATVDHLVDHVDHIVRIAGVDHVGVGLDICSGFRGLLSLPSSLDTRDTIRHHGELGLLTAALLRRGYDEEAILRILGGNFRRVYAKTAG